MVRAGQANLPGNKQKIQMTHNPSGRTLNPTGTLLRRHLAQFVSAIDRGELADQFVNIPNFKMNYYKNASLEIVTIMTHQVAIL